MHAPAATAGNGVVPDKTIAALSSPDTYVPYVARPASIEIRETHLSLVFLTASDAWKLKKPVAGPFSDLRTPAARHANAEAEVRLNRRLAADVYRGVVALTRQPDGRLALGGTGEPVDWLVHMRRLPDERMLDRTIADGRLTATHVDAVAAVLAAFFGTQPPVPIGVGEYRDRLRHELETSRALLARGDFALPAAPLATVCRALAAFLDDGTDLALRVRERRIVEGHGDLRPEHICLEEPPRVIDCLEFSRALRLADPFDEVAFLGLECARLGAPRVWPVLRARLEARLDDRPPERLLAFYTALRALVRARLAVAHLLEPLPRTPQRWLPLAADYIDRAAQALAGGA
jgi:aminoglycoside phosphotransferase family enzyme